MSEIRSLMQAGAVFAERCDNIQYFENRWTVNGIGNLSIIDSPIGPATFWSGNGYFEILDPRILQIQSSTNWTICTWNMWDGTLGVNYGIMNVGGNNGLRLQRSPTPSHDVRARYVGVAGSSLASSGVALIPGGWNFNAMTIDTTSALRQRPYQNGVYTAGNALALNDVPAPFTFDGFRIGEEWGGTDWRGGIAMAAIFNRTLSQTELDDMYGGNF